MTARVAELWRHPIKSLGRERVTEVEFSVGQTMPGDRVWAVSHDRSRAEAGSWARCGNFLRVATSPELAAITSELTGGMLTLRHAKRTDLTVNPDTSGDEIVDWVAPLVMDGQRLPAAIHRADRGLTDTSEPSISLANLSSHTAVSQKLGMPLSHMRWRSNVFLEGLAPWEEFEWEGRDLRLGEARLRVFERIERCMNVQANPETGQRDLDVLGALQSFGHQDFSMAAVVVEAGKVREGDALEVL